MNKMKFLSFNCLEYLATVENPSLVKRPKPKVKRPLECNQKINIECIGGEKKLNILIGR